MKSLTRTNPGAAPATPCETDKHEQLLPVVEAAARRVYGKSDRISRAMATVIATAITSDIHYLEQAASFLIRRHLYRDSVAILDGQIKYDGRFMRGVQIMAVEQKSIADELRTIQANSYIELQGNSR